MVVHAEALGTDTLSAVFLSQFFLLLFLELFEELFLLFALLSLRLRMDFRLALNYGISGICTHLGIGIVVDELGDISRSLFENLLDEGFDDGVDTLLEVVSDLFAFL